MSIDELAKLAERNATTLTEQDKMDYSYPCLVHRLLINKFTETSCRCDNLQIMMVRTNVFGLHLAGLVASTKGCRLQSAELENEKQDTYKMGTFFFTMTGFSLMTGTIL